MTPVRRLLLILALAVVPKSTAAAELSIAPSAGQTTVGAVITTTIQLDTAGAAINAVEASVSFPPQLLRLIAVGKSSSILELLTVDSAAAQTSGRLSLSGGLPSPGYAGDDGVIVKLTWETLAVGQASISITGGKILVNDGIGTDVLTNTTGAIFAIVAPASPTTPLTVPTVGSPDFPTETGWYRHSSATVFWTHPSGLEGVSYIVTRQPATVPDETIDSTDSTAAVTLDGEGVWYFHLRGKYASGWSETRHFTLRRDTTPPEAFTLEVVRDRGAADPSPDILFTTTDRDSGLAGFTASVNGAAATTATSPLKILATRSGEYAVVVTATDRAGNIQVSATSFSIAGYAVPVITDVSTPLILLEKLTVRGTALAGDRVNIFVDGTVVGSTYAGDPALAVADGTTVRLPWTFTTNQAWQPGEHRITATATSPAGQTSVQSDPRLALVRGSRLVIAGRTIGAVAAIPVVGLIVTLWIAGMTWLIWKLRKSVLRYETREAIVDRDVRALREAVDQGKLSVQGIEDALTIIDDEVTDRRPPKRRSPRRTGSKTS